MAVRPVPEGYHTVTPHLIVDDAEKLLEFVERAFGARMRHVMRRPDGAVMHADFVIGDSHVMVGQANGPWKAMPAGVYLYVPDCDAVYRQALQAGGTSIMEPTTFFYGDRHGGVTDPCGNQWWVATHVEDVSDDELKRRHDAEMKKRAPAPATA
jgi:PhnB protein